MCPLSPPCSSTGALLSAQSASSGSQNGQKMELWCLGQLCLGSQAAGRGRQDVTGLVWSFLERSEEEGGVLVSLAVALVSSERFTAKPRKRWTPLVEPFLPCFAVALRASPLVSCKLMSQGTPAVRSRVEREEEEAPPWRGSGSPVLWDPLVGACRSPEVFCAFYSMGSLIHA